MSGESTPTACSESGDEHPRRSIPGLRQQFQMFSKFGDTMSDGSQITLSQSDKWMKQSHVVDGKMLTTTDTAIAFKKFKQQKLNFKEFETFLEQLAASKHMNVDEMKTKLTNSGAPGGRKQSKAGSVAGGAGGSVYDRLCDVTKYGASHRHRFDETGRGRGLAGRRDMETNSGFVQGYKNKVAHSAK